MTQEEKDHPGEWKDKHILNRFQDEWYDAKYDADQEVRRFEAPDVQSDPRNMASWRQYHYEVAESDFFQWMILVVIAINIVAIVVESIPEVSSRWTFYAMIVDRLCLGVFVFEAGVNIIAYRSDYFKKLGYWMDLIILLLSVVEVLERLVISLDNNPQLVDRVFSVFRVLRSMRLLRALSWVGKHGQNAFKLASVLVSLPPKSNLILASMILIFATLHIFTVIGVIVYRESIPEYFGDYSLAFVTMFRVMLRAQWIDIAYSHDAKALPFLCFFVVFGYYYIVMTLVAVFTFALLTGGNRYDKQLKAKKSKERDKLIEAYLKMRRETKVVWQEQKHRQPCYETRHAKEVLALLPIIEHVKMVNLQTKELIYDVAEQVKSDTHQRDAQAGQGTK